MHGTKLIHKLFTKRQNMRPTFMGRTFAADGMSGNGYFAATASISTSAPIGSAATWLHTRAGIPEVKNPA